MDQLMSIIGSNWWLGIIFGVVGMLFAPIILPILKGMLEKYAKEIKQAAAKKATKAHSKTDFENKIKAHDKQGQMANHDNKGAKDKKAKAIEKLKKRRGKK